MTSINRLRWRALAEAMVLGVIAATSLAATPAQKSPSVRRRAAAAVLRRDDIARVAREQKNAVVSLHTLRGAPDGASDVAPPPPWIEFEEGLGSGVVIDASGLILTSQGRCP